MGTVLRFWYEFIFLFIYRQVKKIELNDGRVLYCAWISRDPEEEGEGGRSMSSFALASSFNSTSPLDHSVRSIAEVSVDILAMFFFFSDCPRTSGPGCSKLG